MTGDGYSPTLNAAGTDENKKGNNKIIFYYFLA